MEGEPIVLNYKVTNSSEQEAFVYFGENRNDWLAAKLVDIAGNVAPAQPEPKPQNPRYLGLLARTGTYLSPNTQSEGSIVVSRWFAPLPPGTYSLSLRVQLPYATGAGEDTALRAKTGQEAITKQIALPLTITRADATRLRAVADSLKESILQGDDLQRDIALQKLFSMPAQYAGPSQRALVTDPRLTKRDLQVILTRLVGIGSTAVVDFLQEAAWSMNLGGARSALGVMFTQGDSALKARIEKMFTDRGESIPLTFVDNG
jgi:hypothetical protein